MSTPTTVELDQDRIHEALSTVVDPEIQRPITELGMVEAITARAGAVVVTVLLTVGGCPLRDTIARDVRAAVAAVPGVDTVEVEFGVMSDEQRTALRERLRGGAATIPFAEPGSLTRVYCVASGKGGVGKSSMTVNLAVTLAERGLRVGVIDADIHGYSLPAMLGCAAAPTQVERMIMPVTAYGVKLISVAMFVDANEPVVWRGPMLHRVVNQFLTDVYWGDLDILLIDLPPGTGDIAISLAQLLPAAELIIVTTPQRTTATIAERAGAVAAKTGQRVAGVVENMAWLEQPDGTRATPFGSGGGDAVARRLSEILGAPCDLLGRVPFDARMNDAGDTGAPIAVADPDSEIGRIFRRLARTLAIRPRGLAGRTLALTPS
ncbi:P-loop NTPase [Nocardia sp. CA-145437]|uniref:Mrp/NBP35 family ATP-binding protein n=1 Tax=Nocardia sp. CA-145437 TaxID=3239980 RepID=UPI003D99158E